MKNKQFSLESGRPQDTHLAKSLPLDPEMNALTMRAPRLPRVLNYKMYRYDPGKFYHYNMNMKHTLVTRNFKLFNREKLYMYDYKKSEPFLTAG